MKKIFTCQLFCLFLSSLTLTSCGLNKKSTDIMVPSPLNSPVPTATATLTVTRTFTPPVCSRTLSEDAGKVLAYLDRLTDDKEFNGVISGQQCPHDKGICDDVSYQRAIGALHDVSGKWVGILDLDYEYIREYSPAELSAANRRLIAHWQAGGLVAITWSHSNPWGTEPWQAWKDITTQYPGTDLRELLPGGKLRQRWVASYDRIAAALAELRDAGVVVLWRPMQEMNGQIFWWGKRPGNLEDPHVDYMELWRDMFGYFTCTKGLNNLLWVFSPVGVHAWSSFPYPGDAYVDIVAGTAANDAVNIAAYSDYLAYGKPIGVAEYGPDYLGEDSEANGTFDDRLYIFHLRNDYPRIAYWVTPSSWTGVKMALVDNLFASELMNDPGVIDRDEIAWRSQEDE